jgi:phosphoribosylaminoimidazolecarboxamide formyltransferase/IMP cyclohydrolase
MISTKDLPPPDDYYPVRRALLSVFDKTGIVPFARRLHELGVTLLSTGGTARTLREAGLPVDDVSDVTGYPEVLGGRVKSMHPAIHAGILARRTDEEDLAELEAHDMAPIDLVVTNLYPFQDAIADGTDDVAHAVENIDIGGPTMVRAAAKNHFFVGVVTDPNDYDAVADELETHDGQLSMATRQRLATEAFAHTAAYDRAISGYFTSQVAPANGNDDAGDALPATLEEQLPRVQTLRYGENPHQRAALYGAPDRFFEKLHGKDLSFNNLMDLSAALLLIDEFRDHPPTCAILKHTNPCGVATADALDAAYERAFATDRQSPYGGIVAVNRPLDRATAEAIDAIFTELIIAPDFEEGVLDMLMQKKNRRLIRSREPAREDQRYDMRSVLGGLLVQDRDPVFPSAEAMQDAWDIVTARPPNGAERDDLDFAWRVVKHVKSNAIVYVKDRATLGIGAGQMSRIDASEIAVMKGQKSELDFTGSVVASDAFFPFADGLVAAAEQGAQAAIQPGGSIRDDEVIAAANDHDMAMVFTGHRHFRH